MKYRFKPLQELYWGVVTAFSVVVLTALFTLQPEAVTDWRAWGIALGGGAVRAAAGAALDWLRRSAADQDEPTLADQIMALSAEEREVLRVEILRRAELPPIPPGGFSTEIRTG